MRAITTMFMLRQPFNRSPNKGVAISHPIASMVQRNFGGIVGHAATCAQASGIRVDALEVVEPELQIVLWRIVFHQSQLCPPHWPVKPARIFEARPAPCGGLKMAGVESRGNSQQNRLLQEAST
ncbi:hypothetical protein MYX75_06745, partial [Acidobacteria bacterium AH-259-A15]|nr:hypothetical protein [Acidobacteria bacterium AH-259-A15]